MLHYAYCLVDVETAPRSEMAEYVKPAGNLKDPAKVAESIANRTADLALDVNGARIACLGFWPTGATEPTSMICRTEAEEALALAAFWQSWKRVGYDGKVIGFNARRFDMPMILRRSLLLNIAGARLSLKRYHAGDVFDLFEELTFFGEPMTAVVPRTLEMFCALLKLDVPADAVNGEDIPALVAAGNYDAVRTHNLADLYRTRALAERLRVIEGRT